MSTGDRDFVIREATGGDLADILEIHNDVVRNTTSIYDRHLSTLEQRRAWFDDRRRNGFPVLALETAGALAGYSSFGEWRPRWGYRYSVEHSVHVRADCRGRGYGGALIEALFPIAAERRVHAMVAHIDSAAAASLHLHRKLGFAVVGTFREVGRMHGRWLDIVAMEKLFPAELPPDE
ncbi:MAG: N-acetyltransferase [Bauldia sp.]|nr:N-acetyltransferase [Bauldia sp.]MCW5716421.1 N-acetyltransferase [Bauldia sp.]